MPFIMKLQNYLDCLKFVNLLLPMIKQMHFRHQEGSIGYKYSPAQMCCNCGPVTNSTRYLLWSYPAQNDPCFKGYNVI